MKLHLSKIKYFISQRRFQWAWNARKHVFRMLTTDKIVMARLGIGAFVVVGFVFLRVITQDRLPIAFTCHLR